MTITPKKILLIHKNTQERGRLAIMLSRFGHEVRFSRGRVTDQMFLSNDLVIIDDQLDKKSGLDIINQISGNLCKKVIYLASRPFLAASMELQKELQNLDIYEWVTKPVDPLKLAVVVCDYFVEVAHKQHALPR